MVIFQFLLHVCSKNVKIQGSGVPKSTKNPSTINAKIMPKNVMRKGRKMELKRAQNGSQNRTKIGKRGKKGGSKIDAKKGCNFGGVRVSTLGRPGVDFGAGGGERRGQAPPETGGNGLNRKMIRTRPAPGGVRRKKSIKIEPWTLKGRLQRCDSSPKWTL